MIRCIGGAGGVSVDASSPNPSPVQAASRRPSPSLSEAGAVDPLRWYSPHAGAQVRLSRPLHQGLYAPWAP